MSAPESVNGHAAAPIRRLSLPGAEPPDADALRALHAAGAHFVLCRAHDEGDKKAKSALHRGWQTAAPLLDAVIEHRGRGGLVGMMPGSIGAVVCDLDPEGSRRHDTAARRTRPTARRPSRWWRALLVSGARWRSAQPEVGARCRRAARRRRSRRPWLCDPLESGRRRGGRDRR